MADPVSYGNLERDNEQALIALKKGTQLIKYSRKGKPKFCPFRVSLDGTTLIWYSHGKERNLKLSSVSRIIPGQRTAVFRRYLNPEKEYLSFSLIYNNGERSLDLVCKDKVEADVWLSGLKALISPGKNHRRLHSDITDLHGFSDFVQNGRSYGASLYFSSGTSTGRVSVDSSSCETFVNFQGSDVGSGHANMQVRTSGADGFRISVSSTHSSSSQGSGQDDIELLGDVYIWGEVWCEGVSTDGSRSQYPTKNDVLIPKPLESDVVLDVHQIACGVRHVALVTRQGEVFTWGEECGGRLGHGIEKGFSSPHLVEFLAVTNVDFVACGEYHTCAVSASGDLYTWGDGSHYTGLLGHGTDVSHWMPKRISGPIEGFQVLSVACGTWHSAIATSNGKLFTFGDGTFGVLGHGDRESVSYPREVQSLSGLKTVRVACGVWHTAAIVEVMGQAGSNIPSRKLFTWGDGDKHRLGHGNKEIYLLPTCISGLIDYNFHQLACGHSMTVALTTSGHVFTMGSTAYGQLGNPQSDGKLPCLVQDRLVGEFVEEISCGAYHIAVLTSRSEVFTWGRGTNGRLGHGDTEDRKTPTLVEALKDRHVKNISCGSNYTASICIHKWISGADQSVCAGCRQAFGFTRKRRNCYNCGLVHCHSCSSKKALKAALAPTPGKPHRVCDSCYAKLKAADAGNSSHLNKKVSAPGRSLDGRGERLERVAARNSRMLLHPTAEPVKYVDVKSAKPGAKTASLVPSLLQVKDITFPSSLTAIQYAFKPSMSTMPQPQAQSQPQLQPASNSRPTSPYSNSRPTSPYSNSRPASPYSNSRPASPYSRRPSPPRAVSPVFSRGVIDSLKKTNDFLNQEVAKLQNQVRHMKQKYEVQDAEIQKLQKSAQEATLLAAEESSKCAVAKEVSKSIIDQLKEMTEKLPPEILDSETFKAMQAKIEAFLNSNGAQSSEYHYSLSADLECGQQNRPDKISLVVEPTNRQFQRMGNHVSASGIRDMLHNDENTPKDSNRSDTQEALPQPSTESGSKSPRASKIEGRREVIEQFEPGVYVTLVQLQNGTSVFKRVKFSKRRFAEHQAEEWWKENKDRLLKKYSAASTNSNATAASISQMDADGNNETAPSS